MASEKQPILPIPGEELLQTKLSPPRLHAALIPRPELFARLDQSLDKRLTLITAPTGYGKSTLVSLWLDRHLPQNSQPDAAALPTAWVTLDEGDNDPARFWRYVISAIRQINPEVGKSALATLRVSQQPSYTPLLTGLINELAQLPARTLLIFDDLHTIHAADVLKTLAFLIEHLPENMHIIAMARSLGGMPVDESLGDMLEWPVELLRARGELNELRAEDLRFSKEEMAAFLKAVLPNPLPASVVERLEEKTEGWPAGIRLVTLALQGKGASAEQVIETFNGEHRFVLAYLRKEVFDRQPEPIRAFMLQTCLLDRLTGSLCDCLTGRSDSAAVLEQLEQASLFVIALGTRRRPQQLLSRQTLLPQQRLPQPTELPQGLRWYRYQSLFAEALRKQALQVLGEATVRELTLQASQWYEQHGLLEEAISAAIAGHEPEQAARLMEQFLEQRSFYEILIVLRWCEALPEQVLRQHPLVALNYALAQLFTLDRYAPSTAAAVKHTLSFAEKAWREQDNSLGVGQVLAAYSIIAWWQGDFRASFEYTHQALEYLPESEMLWRSTALLGLGNETVLNGGGLQDARGYLLEAQALSGAVQNIHSVLATTQVLAEIDYLQGEMEAAAAGLQQILADAVGGEEMLDDQSIAWYGLARIAYERNDLRVAEEQARRAVDLGLQRANEAVWAPASILLARIAHARGETAAAHTQLQALLGRISHQAMQQEVWLALAQLSLAADDLPSVQRCLERMAALPEVFLASHREQVDLLAAQVEMAKGKPERALALIRPWQAAAREQGRLRSEIETLCLEAQACERMADMGPAFQRLAAAFALAQPKSFRRLFLDQGEPMAKLIQSAIPALQRRGLAVYATVLLHSFPVRQAPEPNSQAPAYALMVEPLSGQEIRVLRLIAAGRSNPEIAEELVVSVNTVKTQVQSIYRKLNVNSREEARAAAKALSLI